jgi:hypothetical protein
MIRGGVVAASILMTLSACAQVETAEPPAASDTGKNATYSSVKDLMSAAVKAGYPCPSRELTSAGINGVVRGACSDYDSFQILDQTRRGNDLKAFIDGLVHDPEHALAKGEMGMTYLVGPNWVIFGALGPLRSIRKTIGGTIATPLGH